MTRKHFVKMAAIISNISESQRESVARAFADFCESENKNFDRARFLATCGVA